MGNAKFKQVDIEFLDPLLYYIAEILAIAWEVPPTIPMFQNYKMKTLLVASKTETLKQKICYEMLTVIAKTLSV